MWECFNQFIYFIFSPFYFFDIILLKHISMQLSKCKYLFQTPNYCLLVAIDRELFTLVSSIVLLSLISSIVLLLVVIFQGCSLSL